MHCTSCGSESTRKFSVVYEEGTTAGKSENYRGEEAEHFSQTPLAKKCSPPEEPSMGGFLMAVIAVVALFIGTKVGGWFGGFGYGVVGFVASGFIMSVIWHVSIGERESVKHAKELAKWQQSWVCTKCGNAFTEHTSA